MNRKFLKWQIWPRHGILHYSLFPTLQTLDMSARQVMNSTYRGKALVVSLRDCLVMRACVWTSCQRPLRKTGCSWGRCAIPCQEACQTTNMMSAGERRERWEEEAWSDRWGREREAGWEKQWHALAVQGGHRNDEIHLHSTYPRKERKTEWERRDRKKRRSGSSSTTEEIQFVSFNAELNAMR